MSLYVKEPLVQNQRELDTCFIRHNEVVVAVTAASNHFYCTKPSESFVACWLLKLFNAQTLRNMKTRMISWMLTMRVAKVHILPLLVPDKQGAAQFEWPEKKIRRQSVFKE